MARGRQYTREELLEFGMRYWPLSSPEWVELKGVPSMGPILREFGSWKNFGTQIKRTLTIRKNRRGSSRHSVVSKDLESVVWKLSKSGRYDDDTQRIYHMTGKARQELRDQSITTTAVYRALPAKVRPSQNQVSLAVYEQYIGLRNHLRSVDDDRLSSYGQPLGIFSLSVDATTKKREVPSSLDKTSRLLKTEKHLTDMLGKTRVAKIDKWHPRVIDLTLEDAQELLKILELAYELSPDSFFEKYGSSNGAIYLAQAFKKMHGKNLTVRKVHSFVGDGEGLAQLMGEKDSRFETDWSPRTMFLRVGEVETIIGYLRERYETAPDTFFSVYGSPLGGVLLATELHRKELLSSSPNGLKALVSDGRSLEELLGKNDVRFRREWRCRNVSMTLDNIEILIPFLQEKYAANPEEFFARYGCAIGALHLSQDLEKEKGISLSPDKFTTLTGKGEYVQSLLGIEDDHFSSWKQRQIGQDIGLIDSITEFLGKAYRKDAPGFFGRYGCAEGTYYLAKDLVAAEKETESVHLAEIAKVISNYQVAMALTGIEDVRFKKSWNPRFINMDLLTADAVLDFLREEYQQDADRFFAVYGGPVGIYQLGKSMKERGRRAHPLMFGTLVNKGAPLSRLLDIEDSRFESEWKPRQITMKTADLERSLDFLRAAYERDNDAFFERYGVEEGQPILARDLETRLGKSAVHLNTVIGDGGALAALMGVQDPRFETDWKTHVVMNTKQDTIDLIFDFLKEQYHDDSKDFFKRYGCASGILELARDLHASKKRDFQLHYLNTMVANGRKLAKYLEIADSRFETEWNPKELRGKFSEAEKTLAHVRKLYATDPEEFSTLYGNRWGTIEFSAELEAEGIKFTDPAHLTHLLAPAVLSEQFQISQDSLVGAHGMKHITSNNRTTRNVMAHLKEAYRENSDLFFGVYGSRLRRMVLAKELNIRSKSAQEQLGELVANGEEFAKILEISDDRFNTLWLPAVRTELEELALRGIEMLANGKKLPNIDEPFTEETMDYLKFRVRITRGLLEKGGLGYTIDHAMNGDALLRTVQLIAPQHYRGAERAIGESIALDQQVLGELMSNPIPESSHTDKGERATLKHPDKIPEKAYEARRLRYEECLEWGEVAARLGITVSTAKGYSAIARQESEDRVTHSREDLIRLARETGITTSTCWKERAERGKFPSHSTIYRRFGSWEDFRTAVESEVLPEKEYHSRADTDGITPGEDFSFRAGRLLYSFDSGVRREGVLLLMQMGEQAATSYRSYLRKGGEIADVAQEVFERAVARYDPYTRWHKGEGGVLPLELWIGGSLKWTSEMVKIREKGLGRRVSIDSDGFEDERLHGGPPPIDVYN